MAIGVTFPENDDVVTFGWKNEKLVRRERRFNIYIKELGNFAGKVYSIFPNI